MYEHLEYLDDRCELRCICGSSRGITFRRRDRYALKFNFKLCAKCGHVRAANPLSESASRRFYTSSDYRSLYFPGESTESVLRRKTPPPNTRSGLLRYAERLNIGTGKIVEWGCGGGWNLIPFRDAGWDVMGFDFDRTYINLGREMLGLRLFEIGDGIDPASVISSPDVVLINHVIEHVLQPDETFRQLRELCTEETVVIVGVPLLETIGIWHWRDFFHVAHIHYFSRRTFLKVAADAGFSVIDQSVSDGLFALKRSAESPRRSISPIGPVESALLLWKGFLEPRFRIRRTISYLLRRLGLMDFVKRLRRNLP